MKPFPLSLQETFNLAYSGVVKQGRASMDGEGCLYVGPNDTKCAAGYVFASIEPDWNLTAVDEDGGESARGLLRKMGYKSEPGSPRYSQLLQMCQEVHDSAATLFDELGSDKDFVQEYKKQMASVAQTFELQVPE
jgi:hypothetical protein